MIDNKEYKYDAFISYRHCKLDKFVAEKLHKILESYELPKNIKKKLNIKSRTFKRIFRDQEELPLSSNLEDPIVDALNNSKYLIVICSPRLKDSLWCKKEIETFKKIRGRKNIFCVLIEGEPSDSFPEELLYDEVEKEVNGKVKVERIMVEPLAADVRGKNKKEVLKKIKEEKLRLVAPMYNLDYDDLKQRHKLRRQKRILNISLIVTITCLLFAFYTSIMLIKINNQQKKLKLHQATSLASTSEELFNQDNKYDAINAAYQSLTEFEGVKMPYTSDAEYALVESLGLYDIGNSYKTISSINTDGIISFIKSTPDGKYSAIYDGSETLTLFDANTLKTIKTLAIGDRSYYDTSFGFIGNDILAYITKDGNIELISIKDLKKVTEIKPIKNTYIALKGDNKGTNLAYIDNQKLYIYNINDKKVIFELEAEAFINDIYFSNDDNYLFIATQHKDNEYDINSSEEMTIHVIDTKNKKEINSIAFEAGYFNGITIKDNNVYFLMNKIISPDFSMIVASYDYINGNLNWTKEFADHWGTFINRTYLDNNYIAVVNGSTINVLDGDSGELIESFSTSSKIINIYSYLDSEMFLVFADNGEVSTININNKTNIVVVGRYIFNASPYLNVVLAEYGFILVPENDTRAILYQKNKNEDIKEEDIDFTYLSDDSISLLELDNISQEYNINNKSLVARMIYDNKKEVLFINYKNGDLTIYNTKTKNILKELKNIGTINHYFGKDKYGRTYIGDVSNSYILDDNYNKVGHIKSLVKISKDKVYIKGTDDKIYSLKIYNLDEIIKIAKKYLEDNK